MNILILTGKFGMGHWVAAESLRQQLLRGFPEAAVEVVDFPAYAMPKLSKAMYKGFHLMVFHGSPVFNTYYKFTSKGKADAHPPMEILFFHRLSELLYEKKPDVVLATHPLCAQLVSRFKEKTGAGLPLITCITDVTSHPEWINRNTDYYLVPSGEVLEKLVEKGVEPALVCVTGIPVREEFRQLPHYDTGKKELLIMGGGLGLLPKDNSFYQVLNEIPDTHTTIVTGNNKKLFERLHGRWENIQVIGYADRIWEYMARADLIVTKPGGITLFEAIFARVPVFSWQPALLQEKNNARWMTEKGIGWVAEREDCVEEIRKLILDENRLLSAMAQEEGLQKQMDAALLNRLVEALAGEMEAAA